MSGLLADIFVSCGNSDESCLRCTGKGVSIVVHLYDEKNPLTSCFQLSDNNSEVCSQLVYLQKVFCIVNGLILLSLSRFFV